MPNRTATRQFLAVKTENKAGARQRASQQRQRGTVIEWKGHFGWVKPVTVISRHAGVKNGRIYVAQEDLRGGSAPSVGATVDFIAYTDRQGVGAEDVQVLSAASSHVKQEVKQEAGATTPALESLPAPWKSVWNEEHDEWYYWNSETKESSWTKPASSADKDTEQLPEGWEKVLDEEQEAWYYWHKATKTSQWEPPEVEREEAAPKKPRAAVAEAREEDGLRQFGKEDAVLAQQRVKGHIVEWTGDSGWLQPEEELAEVLHPLLSKSQERIYANWRDVQKGLEPAVDVLVDFLITSDASGLRAVDVRPQGEADAERESSAPQGQGWGRRRGRAAGKRRPMDPLASLTKQWAKQDAELGLEPEAEAADEDGNVDVAAEEDEDELLEGPLLPGWEQQWSEEHQCAFFWHKATQQSSWERPSVPIYKSEGADAEQAAETVSSAVKQEVVKEATPLTPVVAAAPGKAMTPATPTPSGAIGAMSRRVVKAEPPPSIPEPVRVPPRILHAQGGAAAQGWQQPAQPLQPRLGAARPSQTWRPGVVRPPFQGAFPSAKRPRW